VFLQKCIRGIDLGVDVLILACYRRFMEIFKWRKVEEMGQQIGESVLNNSCQFSVKKARHCELLSRNSGVSRGDKDFDRRFLKLTLKSELRERLVKMLIFPMRIKADEVVLAEVRGEYYLWDKHSNFCFGLGSTSIIQPGHNSPNCWVWEWPEKRAVSLR